MREKKWSPTPWVPVFEEIAMIVDRDGNNLAVATNIHLAGRRDGNEVQANARLLAAAPRMVEKLEAISEGKCERYTSGIGECYRDFRTDNAEYGEDKACGSCIAESILAVVYGESDE